MNLGVRTRLGYDSNVFSRGNPDDIDSAVWQTSVWGQVQDELERGGYKLRYEPTYFFNSDSDADNTWNHQADAEGTYRFSPRTSLRAYNTFRYLEKIVFQPDDADPNPNVDDGNRETLINTSGLSMSHAWTQRLSSYAGGEYQIYRFERSQDEDNDYFAGFTGLNYALDRQWRVGVGGNASYRTFEAEQNTTAVCPGDNGPNTRALSYSGFASVGYRYDEHTTAEFRAGPARIETTDFVCNGITYVSQDVNQTTWFAEGEFLRHWTRNFDTILTYRRSEGLGGVGTTTVNDVLLLRLNWKPARRWNVNVRASWIHRAQDAARNPTTRVKRTTDTTTWTVAGAVSRQLLQRLRVGLEASYRNQDADEDISNPLGAMVPPSNQDVSDFDVYRIMAFLTYELDPFRF